jgi:hypothetical protein
MTGNSWFSMSFIFFYLLTDQPLGNNGASNVFESSVSIDHQTHSFSRVWHTRITTARVHQIIGTEVAVFRKRRIAYACSAARDLEGPPCGLNPTENIIV